MTRRSRSLLLLLLPVALGALLLWRWSASSQGSETRKLVLTGSSTVAPLAAELAKRFEAIHSDSRIDVQTGGSSRGIADARLGLADIGMVSRSLRPDEGDLIGHPVARDGICIIVHRDNPIARLSDEQIRMIYLGRTTDWQGVGGPSGPITVVHKAQGRSTLELFLNYFDLKNTAVKPSIIIGDNQQGIKTVAGNPGAIGYVSIGAAEYAETHGVPIRRLPMRGIVPTVAHVRDGSFPLARVLTLVTRGEPTVLARQFIAFAQSPEVADLVEEQYFVPY